jgi:1-acyl-sn-glycerol-3-phosphate acyltransferase
MAWLRSLAFNVLFLAWTAAVVVFGLPTLVVGRKGAYLCGRLWARGTFALLAALVSIHHRILGRERLPPEPFIAAVKHQSTWDTMVCSLLLVEPAYVFKRELAWIPLFGLYLTRGQMIAVDRGAGGTAMRRLLRQARAAAKAGRSIVIYPEGTRTAPGASRPYHPGVAALYEHLKLPVVPIALNSGLFWSRRSFLKRPGVITLEILEPIQPGMERRAFLAELERRLETASLRLAREGTFEGSENEPQSAVENFVEPKEVQGAASPGKSWDKP